MAGLDKVKVLVIGDSGEQILPDCTKITNQINLKKQINENYRSNQFTKANQPKLQIKSNYKSKSTKFTKQIELQKQVNENYKSNQIIKANQPKLQSRSYLIALTGDKVTFSVVLLRS
jgi:hypothetical protein